MPAWNQKWKSGSPVSPEEEEEALTRAAAEEAASGEKDDHDNRVLKFSDRYALAEKNKVESYVYETRDKLSYGWADFELDDKKVLLLLLLFILFYLLFPPVL